MRCSGCGEDKDENGFHRHKYSKTGYRSRCKECRKLELPQNREYYQRTRKERLKQHRKYYRRGGIRQFGYALLQASKGSFGTQRQCTITLEDILGLRETQGNRCAYLGVEMAWKPNSGIFKASVDRIDSSKGYMVENCHLVCAGINRLKNDMSDRDFRELLVYLSQPVTRANPLVPYHEFTSAQKNKFVMLFASMGRGRPSREKIIRKVTKEDLHRLREKYQDRCALTGIPVVWESNDFGTASWDRIDSSGNYASENIQLSLWCINRMKGSETNEEALKMIGCIREMYLEEDQTHHNTEDNYQPQAPMRTYPMIIHS